MCGAGRALRPGIWRDAGQPFLWWGAGVADILRARPDRAAVAPRGLLGAESSDFGGHGQNASAPRNARSGHCRWSGQRHHHAEHGDRRNRGPCGGCGDSGQRRLRQCVLPVDQCDGLQCDGNLPCLPPRGAFRQSVFHPDSSDLHPGERRIPVEADPDERVAAQRRSHLGAEAQRRLRQEGG